MLRADVLHDLLEEKLVQLVRARSSQKKFKSFFFLHYFSTIAGGRSDTFYFFAGADLYYLARMVEIF